ncbi:MAG: hypothetical protein OXH84_00395 [Gammaproteobacteria bacterium]|nr:hypothetical protein [Gammaproteobacteria bacterium]
MFKNIFCVVVILACTIGISQSTGYKIPSELDEEYVDAHREIVNVVKEFSFKFGQQFGGVLMGIIANQDDPESQKDLCNGFLENVKKITAEYFDSIPDAHNDNLRYLMGMIPSSLSTKSEVQLRDFANFSCSSTDVVSDEIVEWNKREGWDPNKN